MKILMSALFLVFAINTHASESARYEGFTAVKKPDSQTYVDALVTDIRTRNFKCTYNDEHMYPVAVKNFMNTISDRLSNVYHNRTDISQFYMQEDHIPAFIISTKGVNNNRSKMLEEMKFNLALDSSAVIGIMLEKYKVQIQRVNEGTIREPQIVEKEIFTLESEIRCFLK